MEAHIEKKAHKNTLARVSYLYKQSSEASDVKQTNK